jgi:hypothetical protein
MLECIEKEGINAVLLIDLDAPKEKKEERLNNYKPSDTTKIFFMIQEMEAWILSQPDKIKKFADEEGLIEGKSGKDINDDSSLEDKHPEQILKPKRVLKAIFKRYFYIEKYNRKKGINEIKKREYLEAKDGPKLIGLLELKMLIRCFDEAKRLIDYIKTESVSPASNF